MGHGHDHAHHHHGPADYNAAFAIGVTLNVLFVAVEAGYGFLSGSLALLSDAGHNLSDVLGLLLAWWATRLALRPANHRWTYGLRGSTILAALANAVMLLIAIGGIAWEAVRRLLSPEPVPGTIIMIVAGVGIVINGLTAALFLSGRKEDINIRGAYLHMLADMLVSVGVVVAGFAILQTGWHWIDPLTSLAIVLVIALGTWGLFRQSLGMALDAVPDNIDLPAVQAYLAAIEGVESVHDLHIWPISTTETALTVHLYIPHADGDAIIAQINEEMHDRYGIHHCTIQVERTPTACPMVGGAQACGN